MFPHPRLPAPRAAPPPPSGARLFSVSEGAIDSARQDYIDALPIAAAVLCRDPQGNTYVDLSNAIFDDTAGWSARAGSKWIDDIPFLTSSVIGGALRDFLAGGERALQFGTHDNRDVNGRHFLVRLTQLRPAPYAPQRCLLSLIDKTVEVQTEKNLRAEMLRDSLSGLPNRLAFNERVEAVLADPGFAEGGHAVLALDMTRFSRVNECVGALAGDELLITFARRLFSALRPGDLLARIGGDEFGILLRIEHGAADVLQFADRIKAVLSMPFRLSEMEIRVDCAIGCAILGGCGEPAEEALRNAQFALKHAKASGGTRLYEPGQARAAHRRFSIETDLRRALEAGKLSLAFQPLVDLNSGAVPGFEALARWTHPVDGAMSPAEFIAVAEESGLIVELGRWALETALDTVTAWDIQAGRQLPLYVGVNLSAVQIQRDDVAGLVADALARRGLTGSRLMIEVTESAIIHDPERACAVIEAMRGLGVRVAMDDFGTGYTSLAYLQKLPIDLLKIDGSFVARMMEDNDSTAIVRAVLSLANALGMATAAEGVETDQQARLLRALGCTKGQGYHFARPMTGEDALAYWLSRNA